MPHSLHKNSSSLYRSLAVPFSVFVLMASLTLGIYISYWSQRDALRELEQLAETNSKFIEKLQLPPTKALAEKLSTVLGVRVEFYDAADEGEAFATPEWPRLFKESLKDAVANSPSAFHSTGKEVAVVPFEDGQMHLVLIRESRSFIANGLGGAILIPTIILTIACGCLAFYLAHRLVIPLSVLTRWLPHLEHDDHAAPKIPRSVSGRGDEIGELARAIEETHERLRNEQSRRRQSERMATLGRIATSLAHEIRNPAASIALHADLLARDPDLRNSESIGLIRGEVDRITDLVNQWLFVVRPAPPRTNHHDLVALVGHITESMRTAMQHANTELRITKLPEPLSINCDCARIEQVVRNLLVNAAQAMPEGGEIKIYFESTKEHAVLFIHDSGPGFSEDALKRFGEPFFSEREGGMGIGLTLAREVIEAHHGKIVAFNAPEGGAIVRVQLAHDSAQKTQQ